MAGTGPFSTPQDVKFFSDNFRPRYLKAPTQDDAAAGQNAANVVTQAGGLPDLAGWARQHGIVPNTYAPQAVPDYDRQAQLVNESALQKSMGMMRAAPSPGDLHPQPIGDNPLSAYVQAKNAGELQQMTDQTAKRQQDIDLYNKLLEIRQGATKQYTEAHASDDINQAGQNRNAQNTRTGATVAGREYAADSAAGARVKSAEIAAGSRDHATDSKSAQPAKGDLSPTEAQQYLENAYRLRDSIAKAHEYINNNPSSTQQAANDSGVPFLPGIANSVTKSAYGEQFKKGLGETGFPQQFDTIVGANSNLKQRKTMGQLRLIEDHDAPNVEDADTLKHSKLDTVDSKNETVIRTLEAMTGQNRGQTPNLGVVPMPPKAATQQAMHRPVGPGAPLGAQSAPSAPAPKGPVQLPSDQAEAEKLYNSLPVGTRFIAPNGKSGTKK